VIGWLLARTSKDRSEEEEQSIGTQIEAMERWCEARGHTIADRFLDPDTNNEVPLEERKGAARLLRALAAGERPDFMLVYTVDRVSRHPALFWPTWTDWNRRGIRLMAATQEFDDRTDEGQMMMGMLLTVARYEKGLIRRRTSGGIARWLQETYLAEDGNRYNYYMGGRMAYGHKRVSVGKRWGLARDEEPVPGYDYSPAQVVRWVFHWYVEERLSTVAIAERLTRMRVPRQNELPESPGHPDWKHTVPHGWPTETIWRMLRDPRYQGFYYYGKRQGSRRTEQTDTVLRCPAIVDERIWQQAQRLLEEKRNWEPHALRHDYLLRGMLRCGDCGRLLIGGLAGGNCKKGTRWYYRCPNTQGRGKRRLAEEGRVCRCRPVHQEVEEEILGAIHRLVEHRDETLALIREALGNAESQGDTVQVQIDALHKTLAGLARERANARRQLLQERLSEAEYDEEKARLDDEEAHAQRQIAQLEALRAGALAVEGRLTTAEDFLHRVHDAYDQHEEWDSASRRRLLELMVSAITVDPPRESEPQRLRVQLVFQRPESVTGRCLQSQT
jgi:site-specific DNA recombinase